jgi:endonuclease/exonuclease/phosphatase family metal-dependent hydrolase
MARRALPLLLLTALWGGCTQARNYTDSRGPRYAGRFATPDLDPALRIVTFNVRYARAIDAAIGLFHKRQPLQQVDVLTLQEMDAPGVDRMARALGLDYVYYPGAWHPQGGKDFGNAVLARGPIEEDHKVLLPHLSRFRHMQRIAVEATVLVNGLRIHVYSVHLEAPADISPSGRRDQVAAIVADVRRQQGPVIVAGDFNSRDIVGKALTDEGFTWLSQQLPHTLRFFTWDHLFVRNIPLRSAPEVGVVLDNDGASDHKPVWVRMDVETVSTAPTAPAPAAP